MVNLFWVQKGEYITKNVKLLNSNVSKTSKKQKRGYWDYSKCAIQHHDAHVIKIALEATQLLYNSHHKFPIHDTWKESAPLTKSGSRGYKPSNMNNPISVWIRSSIRHYRHTVDYGLSLCKEYTFRFDKEHACEKHLKWLKKNEPLVTEEQDEAPPCCMPEQYKVQKSDTISLNNVPLSKRRKTDQNSTKENDSENSSKISKIIPITPNSIDDKVIQSYRQYYIGEKLSVRLARWTKREVPDWIQLSKTNKKKDEDVNKDVDVDGVDGEDANGKVNADRVENILLQKHIIELENDIDKQIQRIKKNKKKNETK